MLFICCTQSIPPGQNSSRNCLYNALSLFEYSKRKEMHEKMGLESDKQLNTVTDSVLKLLQEKSKTLEVTVGHIPNIEHSYKIDWSIEANKTLLKTLTKDILSVVKSDMESKFEKPKDIEEGIQKAIDQLGEMPEAESKKDKKTEGQKSWGYLSASCFPERYQPFHPRNAKIEQDKTYFEKLANAFVNATKGCGLQSTNHRKTETELWRK
ncbi:hypothetical protein DdX_22397 [Ditylenchus destructor]|uniref:Uncharacterized protein n=1 Tax=Ditylenchus destructor TaxID=166010 RepID=A0AAD4MHL0_9BILA|nr:hypothetical protein DdX_22397 [Ditylenchus destructor]